MSTKRVLDRIRRWKLESPFLWTLASGFRSFLDNETSLRASALTYYTALATIPVLAILFVISRGFGILDDFDAMAKERFSEHQQVYEFASNAAQKLLQNASGGVITSVAILFLLWTVINILSQVETELNRIWHSHRQRSVMRRVMDYTALIILLPLLTVLGSGFTMWVLHSTGSWVTQLGLRVLPVSASCIVIFLSYFFLPCKRVSFSASALAALIAGLAYQAVQYIFIRFQVGVTTYNTLYGSFAAIPLFLV
ncbi:MAG: YihY/virulence factor BrkB family protein, partial [Chlamydiia bacterium]|nr:YihY/virulence factor BrkB family protein [Chlamydiia bacterium]